MQDIQEEDQRRVQTAVTDIGFEAAEIRTLAGQLAQACTRSDLIEVCTLARVLQEYCFGFVKTHGELLTATGRTGDGAGARRESVSL